MTEIKIGPPPTPNRDKYPFVGTAEIQGIKINIENLAGSVREGKDPKGRTWRTRMKYHYGEIANAKKGADRDKLDVYLGPNPNAKMVYVVHQNYPRDHPDKPGEYDEDKTMLGFDSAEAAKRAYLKQYDRPDFFRSMTIMTLQQFKKIMSEDPGEKVARVKRRAAFIRTRLRGNGNTFRRRTKRAELADPYTLGAKIALALAGVDTPTKHQGIPAATFANMLRQSSSKMPKTMQNAAPAPTSVGTGEGGQSGTSSGTTTVGPGMNGKNVQ